VGITSWAFLKARNTSYGTKNTGLCLLPSHSWATRPLPWAFLMSERPTGDFW
jgi:hypothetical protein